MNHELRRMMVDAEGRYLSESEVARVRDYALTMRARVDAARRLEAQEARIVQTAVEHFLSKHADYAKKTPNAAEKTQRDMALTLRYLAAAHIRADMHFFRVSYATWIAELLRAIVDHGVLVDGQMALRESLGEHLNALDARAFTPYLDVFIEELGK